ncbi:MAG: ferrochelatase [Gemmatimonadales bacterium]
MARPEAHLVLVNLGTPATPDAAGVREFLAEFLSDPQVVDLPRFLWFPILHTMVLRSRPERVARQYRSIWTPEGSPLRVATERIVAAVRAQAGDRIQVIAAYRYGAPSLEQVLAGIEQDARHPVVVVPLFPHRTGATTGTAIDRAREAAATTGIGHRLRDRLIPPDDEGYIDALAARWQGAVGADSPEHLVISFHGIPRRYARRERNLYVEDCGRTCAALLERIGWPAARATLAYQSRFGPEPWLAPATADVLASLPARGVGTVAVMTPGFLTEGLETLEEIAIRGRGTFEAAGGKRFTYIPAVEDHPSLVRSLIRIATESPDRGP